MEIILRSKHKLLSFEAAFVEKQLFFGVTLGV